MKKIIVLLCIGLCGCAVNSGIVNTGKDTYMVSRQAATGFSGSGNLKSKALQEAKEFCEKQGKNMKILSTSESKPPYVFGNFPKAEVQFMCLDAGNPLLKETNIERSPDVIFKNESVIKTENNNQQDLYAELVKLDDLRKKNILSEKEFLIQKKLLLDKQNVK